ncbi:hypothetical protein Bpfe_031078 [Biomphalaria pfeifferi]|uniref:Uncharacterized protein n=1 Tax=Biomphalaria pfeifferi TaxID=112525 RepID=A0AAD8ANJ7_BIOPF|nr:hypothetical protein Bpfe_031078 [Biomphalaria pfeifferi]
MNPNDSGATRAPTTIEAAISALEALTDTDYIATADVTGPSAHAQAVIEATARLRVHQERLDLAWCGAAVARIFLARPWLFAVDACVTAEANLSDEGVTFISRTVRFQNAVAVTGARIPREVATAFDELDTDLLEQALDDEHEDSSWDFATPFLDPGQAGEVRLNLSRRAIGHLLQGGTAVSGLAVAKELWPDHGVFRSAAAGSTTAHVTP